MADRFGQFDNEYSGGEDVWDDGLVGQILLADYFNVQTSVSYAAADGQFGISGVSTAAAIIQAIGSGSVAFTGSAAGGIAITANNAIASGSIAFDGAASASVLVRASSAGTVDFTGSAAASLAAITATVTGNFALSGSGQVSARVSASASGSINFSGTSSGIAKIGASVTGAISLSGGSSVGVRLAGSTDGSIIFSGSANIIAFERMATPPARATVSQRNSDIESAARPRIVRIEALDRSVASPPRKRAA